MPKAQFVDVHYEHIIIFSGEAEVSINVPFICEKCGKCCTMAGFLSAGRFLGKTTSEELKRINKKVKPYLNKTWEELDKIKCFLLTENNLCSIYDARPLGCRAYPFVDFGPKMVNGSIQCGSFVRFQKIVKRIIYGYRRWAMNRFSIEPYGVEEVNLTEKQFEHFINKLNKSLEQKLTEEEMKLFNILNKRRGKNW